MINKDSIQGMETVKELEQRFKDSIIDVVHFRNETQASVKKSDLYDIMKFLKEDEKLFFDCLVDVTAVDRLYLDGDGSYRFEMVYHLHSYRTNDRICIKTPVSEEDPTVVSLESLWKTADWQEREVFDLYGIRFINHPNLKRILLWEGYDGYPLRKDYPLEGRGEREAFGREYHDNVK